MWVASKWAEVAGTKRSERLCSICAMLPERQEQEKQLLFWDFRQYSKMLGSAAYAAFTPDTSDVLCICCSLLRNSTVLQFFFFN